MNPLIYYSSLGGPFFKGHPVSLNTPKYLGYTHELLPTLYKYLF